MAEKESNESKETGYNEDTRRNRESRLRQRLLDTFNTPREGQGAGAFSSGDTSGLNTLTLEFSSARWGIGIYDLLPSPPVDSPPEEIETPSPPDVSPLEETAMPIPVDSPSEETIVHTPPTSPSILREILTSPAGSPLSKTATFSPRAVSVGTAPGTSSSTKDEPPNVEVVGQNMRWQLRGIEEFFKGNLSSTSASVPDTSVTEEAGTSETEVKLPISFTSCIASPSESEQSSVPPTPKAECRPLLQRRPGKAELDEINARTAKMSNSFSTAKSKLEGGQKFARLVPPPERIRPGPSNSSRRGYQRLLSQVKDSKASSSTAQDPPPTGCFSAKRLFNTLRNLLPTWGKKPSDKPDVVAHEKFMKNAMNRHLYEMRRGPYGEPFLPPDIAFKYCTVSDQPRRNVDVSSPEDSSVDFAHPQSTGSPDDQQAPPEEDASDDQEQAGIEDPDKQSKNQRSRRR